MRSLEWDVDDLWAHSSNDCGRRHPLPVHLVDAGGDACAFGDEFGAGSLAFCLEVLHDLGKGSGSWQRGLLEAERTGMRVGINHTRAGAWVAHSILGLDVFAGVVLGHHRGLPSVEGLQAELARAQGECRHDVQEALARVRPYLPDGVLSDSVRLPDWLSDPRADKRAAELLLRMVFSTVVDADRLDTERHFHPGIRRGPAASADILAEPFEKRRREYLIENGHRSSLAGLRERAYSQTISAAGQQPGMFRLAAPTGLGKTIITAGFGLNHACHHRLRRVIVAVPYMSITEQNARVYRKLLGSENVLEHHSGVDLDHVREELRWQKLAAENWDAPFIVTTTVQLFESLFSNKPGAMRKLHRLARSVIVLDEVQALPDDLLLPILSVLRHLTQYFGCTVVLSSATQPEFWSLPPFAGLDARSVIPDPESFYHEVQQARNIQFEWWMGPTMTEVAARAAAESQVLIIVNTTEDAARLHRFLEPMRQAGSPVIHLSKRMASAHIRAALQEILSLLKAGEPVAVVATQLVEAGVDLDFPVVMREIAPIDSLIQAAGRCNRECDRADGLVIVFSPSDGTHAGGRIYGAALAASSAYFGAGKSDPGDRESVAEYYRERYDLQNIVEASLGARIQELRTDFDFPAVAKLFQMIDDKSVPVVVPYLDHATERTRSFLLGMLRAPEPPPSWVHRRLRPLLASLPASKARQALELGLAVPVVGDLIEWQAPYHPLRGIEFSSTSTGEEPA
jgi:CRISPR-associated endonuclease/helicase Cas3